MPAVTTKLRRLAAEVARACADVVHVGATARLAGMTRDAPSGTGLSYDVMPHGLARHDAYHGGQIALLTRAATP